MSKAAPASRPQRKNEGTKKGATSSQPTASGPSAAVMPTYARQDLVFERGEGSWLFSTTGERYLDFAAGVAVNSLGHAHPHLVKALTEQAAKLWHVSNLYRIPEGERLAARLCAETFADRVFFCNSGAEAMECTIKVARKHHAAAGRPHRYRIITFEGAFHGRTLATLAAGGQKKYLEGFGPAVAHRLQDAHRLRIAGGTRSLFTGPACELARRLSRGNPRLINQVADMALTYGFAQQAPRITARLLAQAAHDRRKNKILPLAEVHDLAILAEGPEEPAEAGEPAAVDSSPASARTSRRWPPRSR